MSESQRDAALVISVPGDVHAHAARWALERMGHRCWRWFPDDLERADTTLHIDDDRSELELTGPDGDIDADAIRSVWLRRFRPPTAPDSMVAGDATVAERESEAFLRGLCLAIPDALWVNTPRAQRIASLKIPQLLAARRVGLRIPRTVMTNDMAAVRDFVRTSPGRVVHKGFRPAVWRADDGAQSHLQTTLVGLEDLDDPDSLRLSPGIFQDFIPKRVELRATVFGRTCITAQITEQDAIDWRSTHAMRVAPYQLPADVEAKLFAFMDDMELTMGTADFIVTEDGEHVFLEMNEQGQFLWVEEFNPEVRLLEPFARFLASGDPSFRWSADHASAELGFETYWATPAARQFETHELPLMRTKYIVVPDAIH